MTHTGFKTLFLSLAFFVITGIASAANITSSNGFTAKGPYNILVPLGFEYVLPIDWAYLMYNVVSIGLLFLLMCASDQWDSPAFCILIPIFAGIFAFFGWFNDHNTTMGVWEIIIATGILGTGIYMKEQNRLKWGSGGGGSTLVNFVFYIILLQACVGLVNNTNIWENGNMAPTPENYQNIDLEQQIGGMNNQGGLFADIAAFITMLGMIAIQALQMLLSILATIAVFSLVLVWIFPFLLESSFAMGILVVVQIVIWLLYAWYYYMIMYKPPSLDQIGVG